ncbi:hypothetical protein Bsp3421_000122 (plasmid) [Burkholderia sp. FERM BP-3421]|uniref:hypothetical protein n=1 Tax=Burkholderia sp. FERM BP-3421 TaxID=1494466 RepID=UPI00235EB48B|nr:hypothetical protein [Burkholderia sp. FERM BP-3421]WDD90297.1 hypothetical protein Bsp3421_000122 [Burkholderia sp. FERM BP-3421]
MRPKERASTFTSLHEYLEFGRRADKAAATRDWLVGAFVGAARKRHDFATARLLALRPGVPASTPRAAGGPTPAERGDPVPAAAAGGSTPPATVHVTLRIAPKRPGGRGQVRALERVEREVLADFARTPTREHATAPTRSTGPSTT